MKFDNASEIQGSYWEQNVIRHGGVMAVLMGSSRWEEKNDEGKALTDMQLSQMKDLVIASVAALQRFRYLDEKSYYREHPAIQDDGSLQMLFYKIYNNQNDERFYRWASLSMKYLADKSALERLLSEFEAAYPRCPNDELYTKGCSRMEVNLLKALIRAHA